MFFEGFEDDRTFHTSKVLLFFFGLTVFCQGICYRLLNYLPMLISHSIVSACFCFRTSLSQYDDRSKFFDIFGFLFFVLYRKWCEAQL